MTTTSPDSSTNPDDKSELVQELYAQIQVAVKEKNFHQAEILRERLIQADSMALKEIIGSAELIEQEKAAGMDTEHLAIWDPLYSTLSQGEKICLFYSMKKIELPPKKIILSHGSYNTKLFFIDKGKVTIIFPRKGKNTVLAQLGRGSLLGEYSFTSITLCSATAVTHSDVTLYCLENKATESWHEEFPGLYSKIIDFCTKHGSLEDIDLWKSLEKRNKPRHEVSAPLKGHLLDKDGKKTETYFSGELTDISLEGCAFEIKLSKKATARALLARHLALHFAFDIDGKTVEFDLTGKIVKVSFFMHNDYCIHINFSKAIKKSLLDRVLTKD